MTTPRLGAPELVEGQSPPETTVNEQIRYVEQGAGHFSFKDLDLATPPGGVEGRCYLVASGATGAWSGHDGDIAFYMNGAWAFIEVLEGMTAYVEDEDILIFRSGSAWNVLRAQGESLIIAASDETSDLTTGNTKVTFRMPYAFTLSAVRASVATAPTGSTLIVDINGSGSTILSTKLSIDAGEKTSTTAASPAVISDTALADDSEITIDIDQVGSTIPGAGLKVTLIGTRS